MSKVLGIDLGTTNSCMAIMQAGEAKVITNSEGSRTTPSIVAYTDKGERLVGQIAKRQSITNPAKTIFSIKRLIGRHYGSKEVTDAVKRLPYKIVEGEKDDCKVEIDGKKLSTQEISAAILQKLKKDAEDQIGQTIKDAVITVPAYFNDNQRKATKDAGAIAGFNVLRIINEPTAAALAFGLDKSKKGNIAVYDLGGGTFDISILEVADGVFEVKSTNGDTYLGGDDFDQAVLDWLLVTFKKDNGIDLGTDPIALQRLKDASEKAKIELSSSLETEINLPFITADATGPKHLNIKLTRAHYEQMVMPLIEKTVGPCKKALADAKLSASDIAYVIIVGGMTRTPIVQQKVKELFGKEPRKDINPDEAVAIGASVQGGVLKGDVKDVLLLDVTPLSLGIETLGSVTTKVIEKNTTIPTRKSQTFTTAEDNQSAVTIHVLQGERSMASDNKTLGRFELVGIPPAPRGVPQIEVTFDIDANGILNVKAKDKATGKEQAIKITASSGLTDEEIKKMQTEAEAHADEDKKKKELIDVRNKADNLIYATEKSIKELGDKVPKEEKDKVDAALDSLKKIKDGDDKAAIESGINDLITISHKIAEQAYKSTQDAEGAEGGTSKPEESKPEEKGEDDIIDAEVEKEDK